MGITGASIGFLLGVAILVIGLPVAAVLAGLGLAGGIVALGPQVINSLGSVIWGVQNENLLTAIPLVKLTSHLPRQPWAPHE